MELVSTSFEAYDLTGNCETQEILVFVFLRWKVQNMFDFSCNIKKKKIIKTGILVLPEQLLEFLIFLENSAVFLSPGVSISESVFFSLWKETEHIHGPPKCLICLCMALSLRTSTFKDLYLYRSFQYKRTIESVSLGWSSLANRIQ